MIDLMIFEMMWPTIGHGCEHCPLRGDERNCAGCEEKDDE